MLENGIPLPASNTIRGTSIELKGDNFISQNTYVLEVMPIKPKSQCKYIRICRENSEKYVKQKAKYHNSSVRGSSEKYARKKSVKTQALCSAAKKMGKDRSFGLYSSLQAAESQTKKKSPRSKENCLEFTDSRKNN